MGLSKSDSSERRLRALRRLHEFIALANDVREGRLAVADADVARRMPVVCATAVVVGRSAPTAVVDDSDCADSDGADRADGPERVDAPALAAPTGAAQAAAA